MLVFSLVACAPPVTDRTATSAAQNTDLQEARMIFLANPICYRQQQVAALQADHKADLDRAGINACYDLSLQLDMSDYSYTGSLDLAYFNESAGAISDLVFRLYPNTPHNFAGQLTVESIQFSGQSVPVEIDQPDLSILRIVLPESIEPGETTQVSLRYQGQVPESLTTYGIFNYFPDENVLTLADWFPLLAARDTSGWLTPEIQPQGDAVTSETGLYHVVLELPSDWDAATTGIELQREVSKNDQRIELVSGPVRDFMIIASPNFSTTEIQSDYGLIRQWSLPGFEPEEIASMQITERSLELFSQRYGDYPFSELDVVSVPLHNASGVEYPGLIMIRKDLYNPAADQGRLAMVIAHEVVHQWWYSLIGNDVQQNPWQDEALAMYSSTILFEVYDPAYMSGTLQYFENVVQDFEENNSMGFQIGDPLSTFADQKSGYSEIVYQKGLLFYWALRRKIGDEAFDAALADYFQQNEHQLVEPSALLNTFEVHCGCDLTRFYRDWGVIR
jgi:hypothetical protein